MLSIMCRKLCLSDYYEPLSLPGLIFDLFIYLSYDKKLFTFNFVCSLLLRSLMLSSEVINATKYYNPSEKCLEGLVKASYCSHCSGHLNARPCRPFCQNVIRSCLSELSRLDIEWQRFTNSWQHFSASLVADKNPQTVFMSIDSLIDEAIRSLKSKTHETAKKVSPHSRC